MPAPNTGSIIEADGGLNRTGTAVSTNIIIKVKGNEVGAIQRISFKETRKVTQIDEVGTDGHIDSVPSASASIGGSCERIRFDNLRIAPAFSRGFIHASAQRIPFDIEIYDIFAGTDPGSTLITIVKNVWITSITVDYKATDFVISESMDWEAEAISSTLGGNNVIPGVAGSRDLVFQSNPFERSADKGNRRGALDAGGLLFAINEA